MRRYLSLIALLALCLSARGAVNYTEVVAEGIPAYIPSDANLASREEFREGRFGIFIHWGVYSMLGDGECVMQEKDIDRREYFTLPAGFYPSRFDASGWVSAIKASGARYITFTSRHVDGFSMFGSKSSTYNIVDASPFGRDVVRELSDECHRQGLRLHLYYSLQDWGRDDSPQGRTMVNTCGKDASKADYSHYLDFMCSQLRELLSSYGPIGCIWFDCDWDQIRKPLPGEKVKVDFDWQYDRLYGLIHSLQPACLVGNNHHRESIPGEDIQIFERDVPGENAAGLGRTSFVNRTLPLETCQTMNRSWGYNVSDSDYKSVGELVRLLVRTAGRDANLLLNIGPRPDGTIPDEALERLEGIGKWLDANGETIYGTRATMLPPQSWGVVTHKDTRVFVHVMDKPSDGQIVLPLPLKVKSVCCYGSGRPIRFKSGRDSVSVTIPSDADCSTDYIIEIMPRSGR